MHSQSLCFRIGLRRQEGFGICQMRCGCVNAAQLKMVCATRPKAQPILFIDLRGELPTGRTQCLADVLKTFSKVSPRITGRVLGRSSYRRFLGVTESPLNATQSMKDSVRGDSQREPGGFVHQGSPSPQYWNANLKRTAYPSPLSAGCFSAIDLMSIMSSLLAGELTPVMPNKVIP